MIATEAAYTTLPFRAPEFPVFDDVDPAVLAAEERELQTARDLLDGTWSNYMRRVLTPTHTPRARD